MTWLTRGAFPAYREERLERQSRVTATIIEARDLTRRFGGLVAVENYSLSLAQGDLAGLIGPNGAGKTTAFNLLTGVIKPSAGRIRVAGEDLTGRAPHVLAARAWRAHSRISGSSTTCPSSKTSCAARMCVWRLAYVDPVTAARLPPRRAEDRRARP
jgi:ABC-type transport system involved in cytochrome bd biosynthesis fused ATPase/permease subunit